MEDKEEREINGLTIEIDRSQCIGSGNCVNLAPEVFEIDLSNLVTFTDAIPDDMDRERLTEACDLCPVDALRVENEEGDQVVP